MARIPILGGAYSAASFIANAQRCVNLFPEQNPDWSRPPSNTTHYVRPGLIRRATPPQPGPGRALYVASNGNLYAVIGQSVYFIDSDFNFHLLGLMVNDFVSPVSIADNGLDAIVVDGSSVLAGNASGNVIDIFHNTLSQIGDPNFLGGTRADFLDSFLILNEPGSPNWYSTLSQQIAFNALDFGTKTAWPDNVTTVVAIEREAWIFGPYKSEVWANAGTIPFTFNILQGVIIEHGCGAVYSPATIDTSVFWLNQTREGARMVMKSDQHIARRISTNAIDKELLTYPRVDDAIGVTYQYRGHNFYKIHFPTADRTWGYDLSTEQWHEDAFFDTNGVQHRSKVLYVVEAYNRLLGLGWNDGTLYELDQNTFTDDGIPIQFIRSMPHILDGDDFSRETLWRVMADMESGYYPGIELPVQSTGPFVNVPSPMVSLRISWDRGESFGDYLTEFLGQSGAAETLIQWSRLGYGSDLVIEISGAPGVRTALQGVWISVEIHDDDRIG